MKLRSGRILATTVARTRVPRRKSTTVRERAVTRVARRVARKEIRKDRETKRNFYSFDPVSSISSVLYEHTVGSQIGLGNNLGQREGGEVHVRTVHLRLKIRNQDVEAPAWFRLVLVKRMRPGTGLAQVFRGQSDSPDGAPIVLSDARSMNMPINERMFKTILDKKIRILPDLAHSMGRNYLYKRYKIKINKKLKYEEESADEVNIMPNYHLFAIYQWDDLNNTRQLNHSLDIWTYFTE